MSKEKINKEFDCLCGRIMNIDGPMSRKQKIPS